jgi:glycosyltransferase involved in cell wall biosynthesis
MALPKVLFISHDASRTGAPIVLLTFMRWLKAQGGWQMAALFPKAGELLGEFSAVAPTQLWDASARPAPRRSPALPFEPDLIYFNSVAGAVRVPYDPPKGCRSLCHLHELEYVIRAFVGAGSSAPFFNRFDRLIACAGVVRKNLIENHGIAEHRIDLVHEFVAAEAIRARGDRGVAGAWLRAKLHLPADSLVVGCAGSVEWRKGSDLFVQVARTVRERWPELAIHFVSVGAPTGSMEWRRIQHDLLRMPGLEAIVHFIPPQRDAIPYIAGSDVLLLPSREDPFPLVCLESAAVGTPIVCFDRGGGAVELVADDCGVIVPYADIPAMAAAVVRLLNDPASRARMGVAGREKVRRLYDVSIAGPKILQAMEAAMRSPGGGVTG